MPPSVSRLAAVCALAFAAGAQAEPLTFNGRATDSSEVVRIPLTLAQGTNLDIWTDSYRDGANFDPIIALWDPSGLLLAYNDMIDSGRRITMPGVTAQDAGIRLSGLAAGDYTLTVTNWRNIAGGMYRTGSSLDQGFLLASTQSYVYPTCTGCAYQGWWEVRVAASPAISAVPEPAGASLAAAGLAVTALWMRRRSRR
jgi:hypothetical protein